jgi:phosphoglycolate phosphatase
MDNHGKVVLFDLDGTLVDTAPEMHLAMNVLLKEEGLMPMPYESIRPHVSNGVMGIFKNVFEDNPQFGGRRFNRYLDIYEEHLGINAITFPGIDEVILKIQEKRIEWGIVTNKSKRFAKPLLSKLKLLNQTSCLVCGDTTGSLKPNPEPINHALSLLQTKNKKGSFYIGDSKKDVDAAKAAGIRSIACTYGYIIDDTELENWNADFYVDHALEILNVI